MFKMAQSSIDVQVGAYQMKFSSSSWSWALGVPDRLAQEHPPRQTNLLNCLISNTYRISNPAGARFTRGISFDILVLQEMGEKIPISRSDYT
jgi:hypothetical protein